MSGVDPAYPRRFTKRYALHAPRTIRIAGWQVPVSLFAWGLSGIAHGGLLTATYFATWTPAHVTAPEINLAKGRDAPQVTILLTRWPGPDEEQKDVRLPTEPQVLDAVLVDEPPTDIPEDKQLPLAVEPPEPTPESIEEVGGTPEVLPETTDPPPEEPDEAVIDETPETLPEPVDETPPEPPAEGEPPGEPPPPELMTEDELREVEEAIEKPPPREAPERVREPEPPVPEHASPEPSAPDDPGVETGIVIAHLPRPKYPLISRRIGEEGVVLLQIEVLPDGGVGEIRVLQDPGYPRLTAAAVEAVRRARFTPATRNGKPVRDVVRIPFRFTLR